MIQIRVIVLVLSMFKSGNFFLAHPVECNIRDGTTTVKLNKQEHTFLKNRTTRFL